MGFQDIVRECLLVESEEEDIVRICAPMLSKVDEALAVMEALEREYRGPFRAALKAAGLEYIDYSKILGNTNFTRNLRLMRDMLKDRTENPEKWAHQIRKMVGGG